MEAIGVSLIAIIAYTFSQQQGGVMAVIPTLGAIALGAQRLLPALQNCYHSWSIIAGGRAFLFDALLLLEQPISKDPSNSIAARMNFKKSIRLDSVSFRYNKNTPWVLKNLNLEINKGPENLETIDDRLDELRTQCRKHNCDMDQLHEIKESLITKLDKIDNNESFINNLNTQYQNIIIKYKSSCDLLSQSRVKSAVILSSKINNELPYLKLENAKLEILIEKLNDDEFTINGMDKITFLANTNSGMGMLPINKIASGGELSRFLLAIKVVIETGVQNRTIIFDEIDSGIGGAVANAVGIRLAKLGKAYQTIIVTHSPQVTSKGLHHYLIEKNTVNNITYSKITELFGNARIEEIARICNNIFPWSDANQSTKKLHNLWVHSMTTKPKFVGEVNEKKGKQWIRNLYVGMRDEVIHLLKTSSPNTDWDKVSEKKMRDNLREIYKGYVRYQIYTNGLLI